MTLPDFEITVTGPCGFLRSGQPDHNTIMCLEMQRFERGIGAVAAASFFGEIGDPLR